MTRDELSKALQIETGISEVTVWRFLAGSEGIRAGSRHFLAQTMERIEREHAEGLARATGCERAPHEPEDEVSQ